MTDSLGERTMTYVMKHETWLKNTEIRFKPRSKTLKAIDQALEDYHTTPTEERLRRLRISVHHWKMTKGFDADAGKPAWLLSERNHKGSVATLDLQLYGVKNGTSPFLLAQADVPFYGMEMWAGSDAAICS